jgi:hypothetical protein
MLHTPDPQLFERPINIPVSCLLIFYAGIICWRRWLWRTGALGQPCIRAGLQSCRIALQNHGLKPCPDTRRTPKQRYRKLRDTILKRHSALPPQLSPAAFPQTCSC